MIQPLQKKKLILSVGRFDSILHNKRQDILLKAFKQLNEPSWQLVLAGGSKDQGARAEELRAMAKGSPVTIVVNPSWDELQRLYGQAQIYWHAAGYGEDLLTQPEKAEHFGITTAEAMSAGAVPVVFAGGGQLEIVTESCGRVWSETAELVSITRTLIASNNSRRVLAEQAMERAKDFSQEKFDYAVKTIIG
jgi:glycosyltransferase involved in cell wall biosynthesis